MLDRRASQTSNISLVSDCEKATEKSDYPTADAHASLAYQSSAIQDQDGALTHSRTTSSMFRPSSRRNSADMSSTLSIQAGMHCVSRRMRQESTDMAESTASAPSSSTLASEFTDSLAFQSGPGSSKTSIVTILADSVYGVEDNEEEESEVYELQRVQTTQSMEIQRGVLVACRASNLPYTLPPIFESSESISRVSRFSLLGDQQRMAIGPSNKLLETTPSAASLASSVSVDLADFPLPPVSAR